MITIIDYGAGNLMSVSKAFDHLGVANEITEDPARVEQADRVILPGVGAFGACVDEVRARGFAPAIEAFIATGRPFLGICIGMQILVEKSEESPASPGLGIINGDSPRFGSEFKVPHMGWNQVGFVGRASSRILAGIPDESWFYFVHSYFIRPSGDDAAIVVGTCDYSERFAAVIERDNIFATQFHPEKSQRWGLKLLENFASV